VNSGHQTFNDTKVVVDNLGKRSQTVGGTRGVGDNLIFRLVSLEVDTTDKHGSISRGGRDDDLLGTTLDMSTGSINGGEDTGGFDNVVGIDLTPSDLGRIALTKDFNGVTVNVELTILGLNFTLEATVNRVILEHIDHIFQRNERIVDGNNLNIGVGERCTKDNTTNTTKTL
jgi:hypothetical protein